MSRPSIVTLTAIAVLGTSCLVAGSASAGGLGPARSAEGVVSDAKTIAEQSVPTEAQGNPGPKTEKQSCWHPGLSRNIGIAEQSCDVFTPAPQVPPKSTPPSRRQ
jgi:hypothetical protein